MLVFGAIDFAAAVARLGGFLGYRVTVCDARGCSQPGPGSPTQTTSSTGRTVTSRPRSSRIIDGRTVICVLTHDPKFDVPVLEIALRLPEVGYIGAMGSQTHDERVERLREAGLTEVEIAPAVQPIGLDLGARTPEETAVSIAAEISRPTLGRPRRAPCPNSAVASTTPAPEAGRRPHHQGSAGPSVKR